MKKTFFILMALLVIFLSGCGKQATIDEKLELWKDARFGMFIHWGPVSIN